MKSVDFHWLLAAIVAVFPALPCDAQYAYATVEQGDLRGSVEQTVLGTTYRRFLAIPFAEPPLGELRFVKSRPPVAWEGVRDALEEAPLCLQPDKGSEDCLYLNVFVPEEAAAAANASGELLPVLAWIPGGGYQHGGASLAGFGPDFFLDRGIVVVTMNYRLSALVPDPHGCCGRTTTANESHLRQLLSTPYPVRNSLTGRCRSDVFRVSVRSPALQHQLRLRVRSPGGKSTASATKADSWCRPDDSVLLHPVDRTLLFSSSQPQCSLNTGSDS
ncbi:juvenile hormone esterase-like [Schistocerca americana]|uniref:juvenile hormone esterase-like n=1 Tax=Schistocerca americana TaxID=7009 RepID=UPI001F4F55E9|nr:juvenile hormone esterase-like [Schistocerca americana]